MLHPDSTTLPVAESTGQFAVGHQRRLGAGLVCPDTLRGQAAPAALGTLARFSSPAGLSPSVRRFMLQSGARELLPGERVFHCLRTPFAPAVAVLHSPRHRAGHLGGLQTCGSVWMCPPCMAKISERRREELSGALPVWDGQMALATFTLQHSAADGLSELLEALLEASYKLRNGKGWVLLQERHGMAGSVRSLETTHGANGWHPHLHVLFFLDAGVDLERFAEELRDRWRSSVAKVGRYASSVWGLDVRFSQADVAAYVAKWGKEPKWTVAHELTKSAAKGARADGLSVLQLLELYAVAGDVEAGRLFREYALAFKGRKQLVWSRGLRARLGLVVGEKTDEEVAAEVVDDAVVLAVLTLAQWRVVLGNDARGELCDVAGHGDPAAVWSFLETLGISFQVETG